MPITDIDGLLKLVDGGVLLALVVAGLWFLFAQVWPWFVRRDEGERERRNELEAQAIEAQALLAHALHVLTDALTRLTPPT